MFLKVHSLQVFLKVLSWTIYCKSSGVTQRLPLDTILPNREFQMKGKNCPLRRKRRKSGNVDKVGGLQSQKTWVAVITDSKQPFYFILFNGDVNNARNLTNVSAFIFPAHIRENNYISASGENTCLFPHLTFKCSQRVVEMLGGQLLCFTGLALLFGFSRFLSCAKKRNSLSLGRLLLSRPRCPPGQVPQPLWGFMEKGATSTAHPSQWDCETPRELGLPPPTLANLRHS